MYTLVDHGAFLRDQRRMRAYASALHRAVTPHSVVVDIDTGAGILALLACKFGARRVYAIEPEDVIQVAREIAAANGYAGRIEFIQNPSTRVVLPERADVIVSGPRAVRPLFGHSLPAVAHARAHFLARGGRLIPQSDTLWVALAHAPDLYSRHVDPWERNGLDVDMSPGRRLAVCRWHQGRVAREQLLVEPTCWATLDYATARDSDVRGAVTWTMAQAGTAHGLSMWSDTTLQEDIALSNAPGEPGRLDGNALLPFTEPVALAAGDTVSVALEARLVGDDHVWSWDTRVLRPGEKDRAKADLKQSTAPAARRGRESPRWDIGHAPRLSQEGALDRFILTLMDGATPLGDIAHRVRLRDATRFATWQDALTYVADLSEQYSREPVDRGRESSD